MGMGRQTELLPLGRRGMGDMERGVGLRAQTELLARRREWGLGVGGRGGLGSHRAPGMVGEVCREIEGVRGWHTESLWEAWRKAGRPCPLQQDLPRETAKHVPPGVITKPWRTNDTPQFQPLILVKVPAPRELPAQGR